MQGIFNASDLVHMRLANFFPMGGRDGTRTSADGGRGREGQTKREFVESSGSGLEIGS